MIPSIRLIALTAGWLVLGLVATFWPPAVLAWTMLALILLFTALVDAVLGWKFTFANVARVMPPVVPVHRASPITLRFEAASRPATVQCFDLFHGAAADTQDLPGEFHAQTDQTATVTYNVRPDLRGWLRFTGVALRVQSPLGFWWRLLERALPDQIRVLPDFSMLRHGADELDARLRSMAGWRRSRRRGTGTEFHQLRDYSRGDNLSQLDWKATARHGRLISREYEAERGQNVLLLLDCSRRMRTVDHGLPHFDACLMSAMHLAHIALSRGDKVGCLTFGGTERWLQPTGTGASETLLNLLFDVQPGLEPPDYLRAAQRVLLRQRRRALIVLITNLRDEDSDEFAPAAQRLAQRHLLLVASLREGLLDRRLADPVEDFDQALSYLSTEHYLHCRQQTHARLRARHPHIIDTTANNLAAGMISQYLAIKQAGEL